MCRIAGIHNPEIASAALAAITRDMCRLQQHGGPDDEGIHLEEDLHLALGHRRLSLIDLSSAGHQPMSYADGRYWISYNGEIYNFPEIRKELSEAGFIFSSHSDTEVILAAFSAWGTGAFRRFNGMFAFALLDKQSGHLYLARDVSGIKPLYYHIGKSSLTFASEVRAFAAVPGLQQENEKWPVYLMAYGHIPHPVTTLAGVKSLPKGTFIRYHLTTHEWDIEAFSFYSFSEFEDNRASAISAIREELQLSVKRHLLSDAPIGVFLSGGVDSSLVCLLAAKYHTEVLKTLSIVFDEEKYSERKYQDLVLQKLNCPNWQEVLTEAEFQTRLPSILDAMDMPSCDGINTWFISKYARESGLKAVLSGLGGDELFGGYPSFRRINKVSWIEKLPAAFLRAGRYAGTKQLRRMAYLSLGGAKGFYLFLRGQFIPAEIAAQLNCSEKYVWEVLEEEPLLNNIRSLSEGNQASWVEFHMYMQNQLLRDSDVMSMAHGLEIRVPFLDKKFVSLAMNITSALKYAGEYPKQLLIDSFRDELPVPVWQRPKMGFSFPFAEWMRNNEMIRDTFAANGKKAARNYQLFLKGSLHWSQLMSLLLLCRRKGFSN